MTPLFQKLNLKGQQEILVLNAPASFEPELAALKDVTVIRDARALKQITFSLAFVTTLKEIEAITKSIAQKAVGDAIVWFAYPKGSSRKYKCEFNRDTGWAALGNAGFEGVRLVAVDEDWSAMRFRHVEFVKAMTRAPQRAMSATGRAKTTKQMAPAKRKSA